MTAKLLAHIGLHLRVKQRQASILTQFLQHKMETRQGRRGRYFDSLPEGAVAARERFRGAVRGFNARGTSRGARNR